MHAVMVRVSVHDREAATAALREEVVPGVAQAPGFVAGYWTAAEGNGLSLVMFDTEEQARAAADRVRQSVPDQVTVEDVEVREVVASA